MEHNIQHCTGKGYPSNFEDGDEPIVCPLRNECQRYKAKLALKQDLEKLPNGFRVFFINAIDCMNENFNMLWKL